MAAPSEKNPMAQASAGFFSTDFRFYDLDGKSSDKSRLSSVAEPKLQGAASFLLLEPEPHQHVKKFELCSI
jgi:hypothetical protein